METNTILNISNKMKDICLTPDDYKFGTDHSDNIKLVTNVVIYNSGNSWKVIPLDICLAYPIIYDKYESIEETYDLTFVICPITLRSIYLKGKFEFLTYDESYKMILREVDNPDTLIPIDIGTKIDKKYVIQSNKRSEVKITTLRNALTFIPDALFLNINNSKKIHHIIDKNYYLNKFDINGVELDGLIHPKTLVYLIQYKSKGKHENTIILGKDITQDIVTGYNSKQSHIFDYLEDHKKSIINKEGFIMPILWYTTKIAYPDAKYVYVSK